MPVKLNILVSPLDWGLGHATRIVPLLRYLQKQDHQLIIGVNEATSDFLRDHFPKAIFHFIPSYQISYSKTGSSFSLLKLIPNIIKAKRKESRWVKEYIKDQAVDLIISDSRFGFRHSLIPSVIISHQLNLQYPKAISFLGQIAQKINKKWLSSFDHIWVPDSKDHYLSGNLSIHKSLNISFIQSQSRLYPTQKANPIGTDYILCILSGPEPQRSNLENIIISQAESLKKQLVIVGGQPQKSVDQYEIKNIIYFNHLQDDRMSNFIQNASVVISRSGYSSIMDYYTIGCRQLFFIPTPGQTEQIYLAQRMKDLGIGDFEIQSKFNLEKVLMRQKTWKGFRSYVASKDVFDDLISSCLEEFSQRN
ncbi:MAG: hypothetical protein GQ527_06690 [Bacteroidales bacterium]|nr:hypothetical protein [Bacteroidales bacterium]